MNVSTILSLISDSDLLRIAKETCSNKYAKKLHAEVLFKLLLYTTLAHKESSLRKLAENYESVIFQALLNNSAINKSLSHSSISERLSSMNVSFFEELYKHCVASFAPLLSKVEDAKYVLFDSTIVSLTNKLLPIGYSTKGYGLKNLNQLKFTVGYNTIPTSIKFFIDQKYTSENVALKEAIKSDNSSCVNTIRIFDRGITSRKTMNDFTENNIPFITRLSSKYRFEVIKQVKMDNKLTATLSIKSDKTVYLLYKGKPIKQKLRCIEAEQLETGEPLVFVTNILDMEVGQVTEWYKKRWEIETFFKFIKQELNFSHLKNRSENGIKIMMYMTMITAILLLAYKHTNKIKGFKIVKQKFRQELERLMMRDIVVLCGGNSDTFDQKFKPPD